MNSTNNDLVIINRLRELKEKYINSGRLPIQVLNIIELHRDVLEKNGLLEEFNLTSSHRSRMINAHHHRETVLNHESKVQKSLKENLVRKEIKHTPSNKELEIINRLKKLKLKYASYKGGFPTQYLNIVELHRDVLEKYDLLEEFNLKRRHHSLFTDRDDIQAKQTLGNNLNINKIKKFYTSDSTYVKPHYRRNKNGTLSLVRGHTRRF